MHKVIIYHDCFDGFTAAYYAKNTQMWCAADKCIPYIYEKIKNININDFKNAKILMVDFSFPRDIMIKLKEVACTIQVFEHHKTAQKELDGLSDEKCHICFELEECGASLLYKSYFKEEFERNGFPNLIKYVKDRDLFKNEMPFSEEVNAWLRIQSKDFHHWNYVRNLLDNDLISVKGSGITILQSNNVAVRQIAEYAYPCWICGKKALAVNSSILISEIGHHLLEKAPIAIIYFDNQDKRRVELRSNTVDVSEIAKVYGGGGHKAAAGFIMDRNHPNVWDMYAANHH